MTRLLLVRHGQTADNVAHIMQGQTQGELTRLGIEQAIELQKRLEHTGIDAFYSSDLRRSVDTCGIIARPHGLQVTQTQLLRERDWGSFTGRFIPDLAGMQWPDDIETEASMRQRASSFIAMLRERHAGQTVLAVGHGIINKVIQSVLLGKEMRDIPRMDNAEVRVLTL